MYFTILSAITLSLYISDFVGRSQRGEEHPGPKPVVDNCGRTEDPELPGHPLLSGQPGGCLHGEY